MTAPTHTPFNFPGQTDVYHGKVRDVYILENDLLVMVASDRISAFDVILPKTIPYKGTILNRIAAKFLKATEDICPNWLLGTPAPNVAVGHRCEPFRIEMVIRGYLTGHAWRTYRTGARRLCGVEMPDGMQEHDKFPKPIITPATKAEEGHDEDISSEDIVKQGYMSQTAYDTVAHYTRALFARGTEMAADKGLILVDTKYEFGMRNDEVILMDEIHTPDSSRYFYAEGYAERQQRGEPQKQLSKEFVREWLIENGFQGEEGQTMPELTPERIQIISARYIELYERITGESFDRQTAVLPPDEVQKAVDAFLAKFQ